MINTRFWDDDYTSNLDPIEKLMFLYLLTNTSTNISGIYEIPIKKIAVETGIDKEMVIKVISRFTKDEKIFYFNGWICIKNFVKHQNQRSQTVMKGIENEIMAIPKDIIEKFIGYGYGIDTLSYLNLIKSNLIKSKEEPADQESAVDEIAILIKAFEGINPASKKFYGNTTQRGACQNLIDTYGFERVKIVIEKTLPKTNTLEFFPSITTPAQLWERWSSLEAAIKKHQSKTTKTVTKVNFS